MKPEKAKKDAPPRLLTNGLPGEPTQDGIALRACSLWERQDRPQYQEVETRLLAEAQLGESHHHGFRA